MRLELGVRQFWLAAFRDYDDVPRETKRKDLLAKARTAVDDTTLLGLASFASRLGFESQELSNILQNDPDRLIAERALNAARKPARYLYHNQEQCIQRMLEIFNTASETVEVRQAEVEILASTQSPRRWRVSHDADHEREKVSFFLLAMEQLSETGLAHPSSLFVRISIYFAYFGQPPSVAEYSLDQRFMAPGVSVSEADRVQLSRDIIRCELKCPNARASRAWPSTAVRGCRYLRKKRN